VAARQDAHRDSVSGSAVRDDTGSDGDTPTQLATPPKQFEKNVGSAGTSLWREHCQFE
jgi:hypothetical protein